jgi:hypothetical protein
VAKTEHVQFSAHTRLALRGNGELGLRNKTNHAKMNETVQGIIDNYKLLCLSTIDST